MAKLAILLDSASFCTLAGLGFTAYWSLKASLQYCRRTNFHRHNISWVKFSRRQFFVGAGSPRKFNPREKLFTITRDRNGAAWGRCRVSRRSVTRRLASAITAEGIFDDSEPLGSGRPLSGHRYFWIAIVEVQARVRTVYMANCSLAQFFVGNARPRKFLRLR